MKRTILLLVVGLLVLSVAGGANAIPTLKLENGSVTKVISDGQTGVDADAAVADGWVTFIGQVGVFDINATTGLTKPAFGTSKQPYMDLNSITASTQTGGTLDLWFTETDFTGQEPMDFFSRIGGTTAGTVSFKSYVDFGNNAFGTTTLLSDISGLPTGGAFSATATSNVLFNTSPYSLTLHVTIEHSGPGATSFDAELSPTPEPATMLLLGCGLVCLAGVSRKKILK